RIDQPGGDVLRCADDGGRTDGYRFENTLHAVERWRKHAIQILQRQSAQLTIVSMQRLERDLQRLSGQNKRQQTEQVLPAQIGALPQLVIQKKKLFVALSGVEQVAVFPHLFSH